MAEDVRQRVSDLEDNFTERKLQGTATGDVLRRTLVAFANSVPEHRSAVLLTEPLKNVTISRDDAKDRLKLNVQAG